MDNLYFNQALSNFTNDVAYGAAVRVLADRGCTVKEIKAQIDYPVAESKIAEAVWKHYIDTGVICLEKPEEKSHSEKITYVLEHDAYGKPSYRRKVERIEEPLKEYVPCDFGKRMYQDKMRFENALQVLDSRDRDYILGLPWPVGTVYHVEDERIRRILGKLANIS